MRSIDKLMILFFLGRTKLGCYGIAFVAVSFIGFFPGALRSVLFPRLMEKLGEKGKKLSLKGFLIEPCLILALLIPILIGVVYLFAPVGIQLLMLQYLPCLSSLNILALGFYPIALLEVPLSILIGNNLQKKVLCILLGFLVCFSCLSALALSWGFDIEGVSFSLSLTSLALTTVIIWLASDQFKISFKNKASFIVQICLPFFYASLVLLTLDRVMRGQPQKGFQLLLLAFFEFLILLVLSIAIFIYVNKKINFIERISKAVPYKKGFAEASFFED